MDIYIFLCIVAPLPRISRQDSPLSSRPNSSGHDFDVTSAASRAELPSNDSSRGFQAVSQSYKMPGQACQNSHNRKAFGSRLHRQTPSAMEVYV